MKKRVILGESLWSGASILAVKTRLIRGRCVFSVRFRRPIRGSKSSALNATLRSWGRVGWGVVFVVDGLCQKIHVDTGKCVFVKNCDFGMAKTYSVSGPRQMVEDCQRRGSLVSFVDVQIALDRGHGLFGAETFCVPWPRCFLDSCQIRGDFCVCCRSPNRSDVG